MVEAAKKPARQPAPPDWRIRKLTAVQLAHEIEKYKAYIDPKTGEFAHLQAHFVEHYRQMGKDSKVGRIKAVSPLPLMFDSGALVGLENKWNTGLWFHRETGVGFVIPDDVYAHLRETIEPLPADDEEAGVRAGMAMHYLCDRWLQDVACDYAGKCVIVAMVLSVIERVQFDERPCFVITAGQPKNGKTTLLNMVSMVVTGHRAVARSWSPHFEEQRKAQFAMLREGRPMVVWDNLPPGAAISSIALARALTTDYYADRILGESWMPRVPAFTIQALNGNNISVAGELTSRALEVRLEVDRPDPENRTFSRKENPIEWTWRRRPVILEACYTILLCAPRRRQTEEARDAEPTRFKAWWNLVGSAVEFAARHHLASGWSRPDEWQLAGCPPKIINFNKMFEANERKDAEVNAIGQLLRMLLELYLPGEGEEAAADGPNIVATKWFGAKLVMTKAQAPTAEGMEWRELLDIATEKTDTGFAMRDHPARASAKAVGRRLGTMAGRPVVIDISGEDEKSEKNVQLSLCRQQTPGRSDAFAVIAKPVQTGSPK